MALTAYKEVKRRQRRLQGTKMRLTTFGLAPSFDATSIPEVGAELSGAPSDLPFICVAVDMNENYQPGRHAVVAVWETEMLQSDSFPLGFPQ